MELRSIKIDVTTRCAFVQECEEVPDPVVRDLTAKAGGNALGIGLAEFTTKRLVDKIDYNAMYLNARTAYRSDACKIPMAFESEREALRTAAFMTGIDDPKDFRIIWIKNTLELEQMYVSEALLDEIENKSFLKIISGPSAIKFDNTGNLA